MFLFYRLLYIIFFLAYYTYSLGNLRKHSSSCLFEYNSTFTQEGEVYSPNYPSPYPNNLNCRYEFHGRENELVVIEPIDFQLESPQGASNQNINFMNFVETRPGSYKTNENQAKSKPGQERQCFYDFLDVFTANIYGTIIWHSRHCGKT